MDYISVSDFARLHNVSERTVRNYCAQPLMQRMGIPGTVRASFALYNTMEEVGALVAAVDRVRKMF